MNFYLWLLCCTATNLPRYPESLKRVAPHSYGSLKRQIQTINGKVKTGRSSVREFLKRTLKFSMNPPLPSDAPLKPSDEGRADSDRSPIMHWERVESSACKLSRSDERVRSFITEEGQDRRAHEVGYPPIKNRNKKFFFLYLKSAELLSFIAGNLCIDEFGEKKFSQQGTL